MPLEELYQETLLDHYKNPRNKGKIEDPGAAIHQDNPSCGDQIDLQIVVKDGRIQDIKFDGNGCVISQSSASMMTEVVEGRTLQETQEIINTFRRFITDQSETNLDLGDLEALRGVRKFPVRVKCATLAWTALQKLLDQARSNGQR